MTKTQATQDAPKPSKALAKKHNSLLEKIAKEHLDLETLGTRKMDDLDFSDQAVWSIKDALEAAYQAGREAGEKAEKARAYRELMK